MRLLQAIRIWLHRRRLRAARRRLTARGPATNAEWFRGRSVAYVYGSRHEAAARYSDAWYRSQSCYQPSLPLANNRIGIDAIEDILTD